MSKIEARELVNKRLEELRHQKEILTVEFMRTGGSNESLMRHIRYIENEIHQEEERMQWERKSGMIDLSQRPFPNGIGILEQIKHMANPTQYTIPTADELRKWLDEAPAASEEDIRKHPLMPENAYNSTPNVKINSKLTDYQLGEYFIKSLADISEMLNTSFESFEGKNFEVTGELKVIRIDETNYDATFKLKTSDNIVIFQVVQGFPYVDEYSVSRYAQSFARLVMIELFKIAIPRLKHLTDIKEDVDYGI